MIGDDEINRAFAKRCPKFLIVLQIANGWSAFDIPSVHSGWSPKRKKDNEDRFPR